MVLEPGIEPGIVEHDDASRAHELFGTPETGAARLHGCGHQALVICASAGAYPGIVDSLSAACRRAGFTPIVRK